MSTRFRFRLEKVLEYRISLEEQAQMAVAQALAACAAQEKVVGDLELSKAAHESALLGDKVLTAEELWLWRAYQDRLEIDLRQARTILFGLHELLSQKKAEAVEKSKDKKLLEKLKNKQAERHAKDQLFLEQRQYDEIATIRFKNTTH